MLFVRASGSQVYTCQADADGKYSWTLKAPDAELKDRKDKVIGQHSAGPTWKLKDGSEVTGKERHMSIRSTRTRFPGCCVNVVSNPARVRSRKSRRFSAYTRTAAKPGNDPVTNRTRTRRRRALTPRTITSCAREVAVH